MGKKVAVITTSTRNPRVGPKVADAILSFLAKEAAANDVELSLVDVADFNLPLYDETVIPASVPQRASFQHEHSKRWSAEIARYDAYVLVVPEYNAGLSGATKNAVDYLYNEWKGKPAIIVSYGIFGGKKASEAMKASLDLVGLRVAETRPALEFWKNLDADAFAAMNEGKLGEDSLKSWTEGENADALLKAFGEVRELLAAEDLEKKE